MLRKLEALALQVVPNLAPDPLTVFHEVPLNTREIPQVLLDIANRTRTNPFPWRGQFSPQLVELLLSRYGTPGALVLDPFAGAGTTIFEAARQGFPSVGVEINPAAVAMAQTAVFLPRTDKHRRQSLDRASALLSDALLYTLPLFSSQQTRNQSPAGTLVELTRQHADDPYLHNIFTNTLVRLLEVQPADGDSALRALEAHRAIVLNLPHSSAECRILHTDARTLPLASRSVGLVVTSPPYINVFNYHQNNRRAMELLDWELLTVAKSEVGSNRKNRGNRFLTVVQYCVDMLAALTELRRVLKPTGRAIIVVGRESNVRGLSFRNGSIVATLATLAGFKLPLRQERKFTNKFGAIIYEDILHLQPTPAITPAAAPAAYAVAQWFLTHALSTSPSPALAVDLRAAIETAPTVPPSPIFNPSNATRT